TSVFQTALSHINVLSNSRGTPNMALREAWTNQDFNDLEGQLIYLKVRGDHFEIRKAILSEAEAFWEEREPQKPIFLEKDLAYRLVTDIENISISDINKVGGKAANFGELVNVGGIPTPENAFAIPFYYYEQHMAAFGLNEYVDKMLSDPEFETNATYRNEQLDILRDSIKDAPINPALVDIVSDKIADFRDFPSFRFRSSTNAEDLEDFSGAGLYDSKSAKKDHETKTIETAIKKVWASLWSWRAFEERDYFKIDHQSCAMGILVHRSFPDEDANGVLVTKNLYNENPGFIINVQYKEESIVFPEPGTIHDQIMLFTWSVNPGEEFMIEYLSFSNVPELNGERVMTDEEVLELGRYAKAIKERFYYDLNHNCNCTYTDFGVDIEFKVDSDVSTRKIYVKQARLFK
ncbi:MAG: PEP/pyruvate-binding domain-containing protein, partial [Ekhidna sp.]